MKSDKMVLVVALIVVLVIALFGFGRINLRGYGAQGMCGMMGGIWCYWPSLNFVIQILIVGVLVLLIFWLYKELNGGAK